MAHGVVAFSELGAINWAAPWLQPWRRVGHPLATYSLGGWTAEVSAQVKEEPAKRAGDTQQSPLAPNSRRVPSCADALNAAPTLAACPAAPVRFVPQSDLPAGVAYESYIFNSNCCPTREGLHDFFNGLAWLLFPQTKRRLNQLHVAQIAQTGIQPVRGSARDGLTVFDENAAFLQCPDALWEALAAKDWTQLFGPLRSLWAESNLVLFGHALLEKLVYPRKPITAHVYRAQAATQSIADLDQWMAADLSATRLAAKPFAHLPVLGVPGWWPDNDNPGFYEDVTVFRPPRPARHTLAQDAGQRGADFGTDGS